jgi:hypothetical protein
MRRRGLQARHSLRDHLLLFGKTVDGQSAAKPPPPVLVNLYGPDEGSGRRKQSCIAQHFTAQCQNDYLEDWNNLKIPAAQLQMA